MKSSKSLLSRLPTVNEILENPRLKAMVERVNQMEVTAGVRQYVERARQELSRRSLDMPIPSISELTERAARFILRNRSAEPVRVINATGDYWPVGMIGPPLAEEAIIAATDWMQHYHDADTSDVEESLADATGGEGALACNTPSAALWLAMAGIGQSKGLVVARGELGTLDDGIRITELAVALGMRIVEVGAVDRVTIEDYRQALATPGMCLLRVESLRQSNWPADRRPALPQLTAVAKSQQGVLLHYLHQAPLLPLDDDSADAMTVTASLRQGADLTVVRGDGQIGGPSCGLVVGKRRLIDAMRHHPLGPLVRLHPSMVAALAVTLTLWKVAERQAGALPILALRSTPLENLRLRAERITAQLEPLAPVASAKAVALEAGPTPWGVRELASHGVQIALTPEWTTRGRQGLAEGRPRLEGLWVGKELLLDLRTVFPGENMEIVSLLEGLAPEPPAADSEAPIEAETKETA